MSILWNTSLQFKNKKNVPYLNGSPGTYAEKNQAGPERWLDHYILHDICNFDIKRTHIERGIHSL